MPRLWYGLKQKNMTKPLAAIACNLDSNILLSALPLLEAEKIEAIEWSFDTLSDIDAAPEWFCALLQAFSAEKRLIGHGVFFSLFSGKWRDEQSKWLENLRKSARRFNFDHITEHFGFMTGADFHKGAPLSIPYTDTTLSIGIDRLKRIQEACNCPVGLENLAFSYTLAEVEQHGIFLEKIVESVNGFIILDLHNFYCQLHNFEIDYKQLLSYYPLDRVREIHISGGSWESTDINPDKNIRRDTHDDSVPEAVFELLKAIMPLCPNLKFVVLEQLGVGLTTPESQAAFRQDFLRLKEIIADSPNLGSRKNDFLPKMPLNLPLKPIEDSLLYAQQLTLSEVLYNATDLAEAQRQLAASNLANTAWEVEKWQPEMLETAIKIAQKWQ